LGQPRTKKNSQQIFQNRQSGRPFITQSTAYKEYEQSAAAFLKPLGINEPVNVSVTYFMQTKRRVDLSNLLSAINDILVKHGVLADDNRNIVAGHDGSRVLYDKQNPRCEIVITKIDDYEIWGKGDKA
jgi:Holliday junction resolvase RusA-like endonuclease